MKHILIAKIFQLIFVILDVTSVTYNINTYIHIDTLKHSKLSKSCQSATSICNKQSM